MDGIIKELYEVVLARKESSEEGSYTGYLFREGLDKILKKVGEESSEVIIAAKSLQAATDAQPPANQNIESLRSDFSNEVCDLLYHLLVLLAERNVPLEDIETVLTARAAKTDNLKR
jgi:phosphoribosyl-ATP pyrophosphohydrolase